MNIIIDANILFATLIKSGKTEELILNENIQVYAPEYIFIEFKKYTELILEKTSRNKEEIEELLLILQKYIKTIPNEETEKYLSYAKTICPDPKDVEYFALALKLRCPIWSNDKKLKEQNKITIYNTKDLIKKLEQIN